MMEEKHNSHQQKENFWLPLDNAAKIFPAVISNELTTVFRLSTVLKDRININNLISAVNLIKDRFPYYKVRLKKGFFWYYLEYADLRIPIEFEQDMPCRKFPAGGLLFRILAVDNRLSIEFSHILTDGSGAFEF